MPLLPPHWRVLAGPPSLASCSRDVYDEGPRLPAAVALRIAASIADAGAHLHERGLLHGDLYAHNILWDGTDGNAVLSDFGAASFMPSASAPTLARLDVLGLRPAARRTARALRRCVRQRASAAANLHGCSRNAPAPRRGRGRAAGMLDLEMVVHAGADQADIGTR